MRATVSMLFVTACAGVLSACSEAPGPSLPRVSVPASMETAAVAGAGDAADDPALWRATNPAQSRILGTDKKSGLYVYTLDGETAQYLAAGRMNNVDVRYGFEAGEETVDIAVASDRTNIALAVFFIDRETGTLSAAPGVTRSSRPSTSTPPLRRASSEAASKTASPSSAVFALRW